MLIMFAESVHGTLRQLFLAPAVGDFTARRISFFTGMLLIFVITYLLLRWIGAPTSGSLLVIGTMFMGKLWIDDLKKVVDDLGFDYRMEDGHTLQDYCPRCKRIMRGLAYAGIADKSERVFHGTRVGE